MATSVIPERREMKLQRLLRPLEIKGISPSERTFEGFSAAYELDLGGDIIYPGAFAKTLQYWKAAGFAIPLVDHHRHASIHDVLGSVIDAEEQEKGLWSKFEVDDGSEGDKLLRHIERKRLNGLSIGYNPVNPEVDKAGIRHLREIQWKETSPVIWPMNPSATIDANSVKSLLTELSEDVLGELREALETEAKARHEKANPPLPSEKANELRARLISLRLRPLLSRTSGQNHAHLTLTTGKHNDTEREESSAG